MNMKQFAKLIGMDEDELFGLSYEKCSELLRKHGYHFTGRGIVPIPPRKQEKKDRS